MIAHDIIIDKEHRICEIASTGNKCNIPLVYSQLCFVGVHPPLFPAAGPLLCGPNHAALGKEEPGGRVDR
ncbi:hypothetical protein COCNU_06G008920 [Cocos nucifera]|uniref:Uncharacterized protein n=1 Tax=Cocos nucifera TaxID=13894 RepID=A0A8K0N2M0_COCNU|nr:hypothetical protein COCNU_06G008920 [Cocos nucifera]